MNAHPTNWVYRTTATACHTGAAIRIRTYTDPIGRARIH